MTNVPALIEFNEDESVSFLVDTLVTDVDNALTELLLTITSPDTALSNHLSVNFDPASNIISIIPDENFYFVGGQLYVTVTDPGGLSDQDTVDINILPVNDAPYFLVDLASDTIKQDSTGGGNIWEIVEDVETPDSLLIYTFDANPDSVTIVYNSQTGDVTLTPFSGFVGNISIVITVSDGELSASDTLLLVVEPAVGIADWEDGVPVTFDITQNYPNPFNPNTTFKFSLPKATDVRLTIYNVLGQKVRTLINARYQSGVHEIQWDGTNDFGMPAATGVYIYRFEAGSFIKVMKMTLMK